MQEGFEKIRKHQALEYQRFISCKIIFVKILIFFLFSSCISYIVQDWFLNKSKKLNQEIYNFLKTKIKFFNSENPIITIKAGISKFSSIKSIKLFFK